MYFTAPAQLLKSQTKFEKNRIWVKIIASDEELDMEDDNMLSKSFTDEVRDFFLKAGIFDWDHITIRGSTSIEKYTGIIGTPTDFYEKPGEDGSPVQWIEGYMHRGNPYVDNTIAPMLKSGSDRLAVSIGGKILGFEPNEHYKEHRNEKGKLVKTTGRSVNKIWMNHLAFCPKYKSVNYNTSVNLMKSTGINGEPVSHFRTTKELLKTLEAGNNTDSATITGAQAIQPQSLEGSLVDRLYEKDKNIIINQAEIRIELKSIALNIMHDIISGIIGFDSDSVRSHCLLFGLGPDETNTVSSLLLKNMSDKIEKIKNY